MGHKNCEHGIPIQNEWLACEKRLSIDDRKDFRITKLEARNARLLAALKRAKDHLEYCGYGDEWERGINDGKDQLDKQIKSALAAEEKEQSK